DNVGASAYIYLRRLRVYYSVDTGHPEDGEFLADGATQADAFYQIHPTTGITALGAAAGLYAQGVNVPTSLNYPSSYNPAHKYVFYMTGSGAKEEFRFAESGIYTDNSGNLTVTIEGIFA